MKSKVKYNSIEPSCGGFVMSRILARVKIPTSPKGGKPNNTTCKLPTVTLVAFPPLLGFPRLNPKPITLVQMSEGGWDLIL